MGIKTKGLFRPEWYMGKEAEQKIKQLLIGRTLNFPCGRSLLGDVKADLDSKVIPDKIVDLLNFKGVFKPFEFDTVFCDPPFSFYTDNRIGWKWIYNVSGLAKKRVIFKTPKIRVKLKSSVWKKHYVIIEDNKGFSFQFLQVFDRLHKPLGVK